MKSRHRGIKAILAALVVVAVTTVGGSAEAGGDPQCPHGANYASTACFIGGFIEAYTGWTNQPITMSNADLTAGRHANETLWAYGGFGTATQCTSQWAEIGFTRGYYGQTGHYFYVARVDNGGNYADFNLGTADTTSYHTYRIRSRGGATTVYLDGVEQFSSNTVNTADRICIAQSGVELSSGSNFTTTYIPTFYSTPLYWKDWFETWMNGWWISPDHVSQWIDQPCGAGFSSPNCFNGVYAAVDNWGANKP